MRVWRVAGRASRCDAQCSSPAEPRLQPLALPDKPSIAVLPFQNMSGDPEQEYFADGMVEDIITALSRFKSLFVIARNSSFTYKGRAVDVKQVGRELGVRYVLEGSVRKAGEPGAHHRPADRGETGQHISGPTVRRRAGGHVRAAGPSDVQRRRGNRSLLCARPRSIEPRASRPVGWMPMIGTSARYLIFTR